MLIYFDGVSAAATQLNQYFWPNQSLIPEPVRDLIQPLLGQTRSPVDAIVKISEIVYANRGLEGMPAELMDLAAASAVVAETFGFHGMDVDSRGSRISLALRRESGEEPPAGGWPAPETDPAPLVEYTPPPPPAEEPPVPPPGG